MAIPGAGIPRKEVFCVSSMLNLAKRMAEKTGKRKAIQGDKSSPNSMISGCWAWLISQYMMNPGATPKETTSESESKSAPMGEWAWSNRAAKPSRKSKSPATKIMMAALTGIPDATNRMERQPETKLPQVMVLGICCLRLISSVFMPCKGNVFSEKQYLCGKIENIYAAPVLHFARGREDGRRAVGRSK